MPRPSFWPAKPGTLRLLRGERKIDDVPDNRQLAMDVYVAFSADGANLFTNGFD